LVFLDESGASMQMTRNYGPGLRGGTPDSHSRTVTGADPAWVQWPMTIESATDGDVLLAYLEQILCPQLNPGEVGIMDKLVPTK
jgi:hypothetical protein